MKNKLSVILFWAVCWGLAEAVIGFVLHFAENSAGILLYPFGAYCLFMAFEKSGKKAVVPVLVTLITAFFKLSNLAFTSPEFHYRVYFPVMAILSEGLITSGLLFITTLVPVQNVLINPGTKK